MLQTLLQLFGVVAHSAGTAREGLRMARQTHPSVILLDLMLPDLDGRAFRRQQQRDPDVAEIPVIVVSAHPAAKAIAGEMGAAGCIGKPIDFDALLAKLSEVCDIDGITPV